MASSEISEADVPSRAEVMQHIRRHCGRAAIHDSDVRRAVEVVLLHGCRSMVSTEGRREIRFLPVDDLSEASQRRIHETMARLSQGKRNQFRNTLQHLSEGGIICTVIQRFDGAVSAENGHPALNDLLSVFIRRLRQKRFPLPIQRAIEALALEWTFTRRGDDNATGTVPASYSLRAAAEACRQLQKISDWNDIARLRGCGVGQTAIDQLLTLHSENFVELLRPGDRAVIEAMFRETTFIADTTSVVTMPEERMLTPSIESSTTPPVAETKAVHPVEKVPGDYEERRKKRRKKKAKAKKIARDREVYPSVPAQEQERNDMGSPEISRPSEHDRPVVLAEHLRFAPPQEQRNNAQPVEGGPTPAESTVFLLLNRKSMWPWKEFRKLLAWGGASFERRNKDYIFKGPSGMTSLGHETVQSDQIEKSKAKDVLRKTVNFEVLAPIAELCLRRGRVR